MDRQYAKYLLATQTTQIPAAWAENEAVQQHSKGNVTVNHAASNVVTNGANGHAHINGHFDKDSELPASFLESKSVRTVYGLVPLKYALDWPVSASYNEVASCASWMGGRIPTFEEARSIYEHVGILKKAEAERKLGKTVPAVNG